MAFHYAEGGRPHWAAHLSSEANVLAAVASIPFTLQADKNGNTQLVGGAWQAACTTKCMLRLYAAAWGHHEKPQRKRWVDAHPPAEVQQQEPRSCRRGKQRAAVLAAAGIQPVSLLCLLRCHPSPAAACSGRAAAADAAGLAAQPAGQARGCLVHPHADSVCHAEEQKAAELDGVQREEGKHGSTVGGLQTSAFDGSAAARHCRTPHHTRSFMHLPTCADTRCVGRSSSSAASWSAARTMRERPGARAKADSCD